MVGRALAAGGGGGFSVGFVNLPEAFVVGIVGLAHHLGAVRVAVKAGREALIGAVEGLIRHRLDAAATLI